MGCPRNACGGNCPDNVFGNNCQSTAFEGGVAVDDRVLDVAAGVAEVHAAAERGGPFCPPSSARPAHEPAASAEARLAECAAEAGGHAAFWQAVEWVYAHTRSDGQGLPDGLRYQLKNVAAVAVHADGTDHDGGHRAPARARRAGARPFSGNDAPLPPGAEKLSIPVRLRHAKASAGVLTKTSIMLGFGLSEGVRRPAAARPRYTP